MKAVLGYIDCPACGTAKGMRITPDKNGDPFGFCEAECGQQLRVGGDKRRVRSFVARYPWAAGEAVQDARTVADLAQDLRDMGMTTSSRVHEDKPVTAPEQEKVKPVVKRSPLQDAADYLLNGGVSA